MRKPILLAAVTLLSFAGIGPLCAEEWRQFRGPGGQRISSETGIPVKWSARENIAWRADLPGPGSSSPINN